LSVVSEHHTMATMELSVPIQMCGKVDSIDLPCMKTPSHSFEDASDVRSTII
jgi:hypothetical protein